MTRQPVDAGIVGVKFLVEVELQYQGLGWVEGRVHTPLVDMHIVYTPT